MTNQAMHQLCLNRIKSPDFGQPKRVSLARRLTSFCIVAMLAIAYIIVGA